MKKIIILLLSILLFSSCLKDEVSFKYIIRVYVTDYEGSNIKDADVTLKYLKNGKNNYSYTYTTEGYYEFADLFEVGEYQIWVQKKGNIYKDNYEGATLNENKVVSVNIKLEKF